MIDYKIFNVTDLATNCVYLIDKETGCNAVVDPGAKSDKLIAVSYTHLTLPTNREEDISVVSAT